MSAPPPPPANAPINSVTVGSITGTGNIHVSTTRVTSSITIPAGQTTGSFTITTNANSVLPGSHRSVQILAAAVTTKFALLTVTA